VVSGLHLGRRQVAAVFVEAAVVEPVDPLGGGDLDVVDAAPWAVFLDQLGLVEAVDRLGQSLSKEDPTALTEGLMPARASRSLWASDVY